MGLAVECRRAEGVAAETKAKRILFVIRVRNRIVHHHKFPEGTEETGWLWETRIRNQRLFWSRHVVIINQSVSRSQNFQYKKQNRHFFQSCVFSSSAAASDDHYERKSRRIRILFCFIIISRRSVCTWSHRFSHGDPIIFCSFLSRNWLLNRVQFNLNLFQQ